MSENLRVLLVARYKPDFSMLVVKIAGVSLTEPKAFVVHNGTDFVPYSNFKKPDNSEIVIASVIGKEWQRKGLDILVKSSK